MTIKDIARLSGYGVSTVSRALNGHPDVSEETKNKINEIVEKYKFVPNSNARQLKQNQSKDIAIIVKGSFNLFFATIIENIQIYLSKANINAMVHYSDEYSDEVKIAQKVQNEQKPMGIIFLGGNIEFLKKSFKHITVPCVLCTTNGNQIIASNLSSVSVDDIKGAEAAVDFLLQNSHKHIGIIGGNINKSYTSKLRLMGCENSFAKNQLTFSTDYYEESDFSINCAYEATKTLLSKHSDITAIFAMSDIMALGTISAIHDMGKSVPDDISVIGFDGIELGKYYIPKLTTIKQPEKELAKLSVKKIINMINNTESSSHILLNASLLEGNSVKKI
ncbi:LacI family DNA-binding transcriptional regulator [Paludicola sp. MB14-C6]|uniref:LacI family DNA-binding transcriptional regulator n=1 Tax=Paludihabitans sp. MB14-C6 TaxID=3070656 RepID=UPI0027DCC86D|nr:LacI family DNA-binding transcriptional regulator [Paludicola sp. MB14-C6]WMJ23229.1 LacI family DNA-binding transcriptional regulator [Paludicola sp. MB14-C6]